MNIFAYIHLYFFKIIKMYFITINKNTIYLCNFKSKLDCIAKFLQIIV